MKAKFVNERFEDKSDPIRDMNIGSIEFDIPTIVKMYKDGVAGYYLTRATREQQEKHAMSLHAYHEDNRSALWNYVDEVDPGMHNYSWEIRLNRPKHNI